jgi:hypothetical protein
MTEIFTISGSLVGHTGGRSSPRPRQWTLRTAFMLWGDWAVIGCPDA